MSTGNVTNETNWIKLHDKCAILSVGDVISTELNRNIVWDKPFASDFLASVLERIKCYKVKGNLKETLFLF